MENKYTGEVPYSVGDKKGVMVIDYAALAAIKSKVTQADLENLVQMSPEKLAHMAACAFKKLSPEITYEYIMEQSPPIMQLAEAVDRAMLFSFHGPENARKILEPIDNAVDEFQETNTKKKPQKKKT